MVEDTLPPVENTGETVIVERRPLWQRILRWVGIVLAAIALLLVLIVLGLNTSPGRRFLADRIGGFTTASGLNVKVGRIDGSIYGAMILRDIRVSDPRGVFAMSPQVAVDWRPFAFARSHVDVRSLTSPLVRVARLPELKAVPSDPDAPLLPDIDIDVNRLAIDRIDLAAPVAGQRYLARIAGEMHIADRRAQLLANGATLAGPGIAGGDRVTLALDAVPDDNRLDIDLKLDAPATGLVASMAGLKSPLRLTVDGDGSWQRWQGRLSGTLGGAQLANLGVQARNGFFQVRGAARPGLYLEGPVERLTAPALQIALDARLLEQRRLDTNLRLRSDAMAVATQGLLDLGRSRFGDFRVEGQLLTPGAIAENLNGNAVRAEIALNGAFAAPTVDYKVQAAAIGFGETRVERLYAEGQATVDADRILIPVNARAARIAGLNAAVGGLVTNVALNGDIAINGDQILSDNMRIRSDRIDATAVLVADMGTGRYTGALKGRVNDYEVASIGIIDLQTSADLYTAPNGGYGIRGRVVTQTKRLFNDGIRSFLGGNATAAVDVALTPEGLVTFDDLRLNSPQFRITRGRGSYDFAGPLRVEADAYSTQYGPLTARVSGSVAQPVVLLRAPRPGVGIGLADLEARVRGQGDGYAIVATGGTNYGPFNANVLLRTSPRLTADIRDTVFAGVTFNGRVAATDAGPFAGALDFAGSGVVGRAELGAQGRYQTANVDARANNATIPGDLGISIGRAIANARVVLYDDAPAVTFDAQVANFRQGEYVVTRARARGDYRGGNGYVQAVARGTTGVPFDIAANARLSPALWVVALKGKGNGIDFRTAQPARIDVSGDGYRLLPTRIVFDQGALRVAGRYGDGYSAQGRLDRLDLQIANALVPGLGLGGTASGSFEVNQGASAAYPTGSARILVNNFTRSGLSTVSTPVDIQSTVGLTGGRADMRAIVQRGGATIGRVVAQTGTSASAPLTGGIRYNGPSEVLWSLGGIADQQLSGPVGIAADFGGTLGAPRVNGLVRANNLVYENETYGTRLSDMRLTGRFTNDRFVLEDLRATAGDGSVTAQGFVGLASNSGFPVDIRATLQDAQLARSDMIGATATGNVRVTNGRDGGLIEGDIRIPEARYQVIRQGSAEVAELSGVRRRGTALEAANAAPGTPPPSAGLFRLNIRVSADNQLYVSGMGLESEWEADLRITGTSSNPRIVGQIEAIRGTYSFAGKRFELDRGLITYEGNELTNPNIVISASTTTEGVTATINVTGTAQRPRLSFTSTPALAQDEVLARILFGRSVTNLSAIQAIQLASALNSLRGSGGGLNPLGELQQAGGIDRLRILGADEASGRGTALAAGQYLTDDIYVEIITDARGFTATQLEIALSRALSLLSQTGSFGGSSVNLRYSRDY
ncbi:translocation/assembly module TamB domain-containing protein [Sphingomonas sp.]|uniref:translocation/assembly module TamB domain-containing protein n=1 Tax=Sphingomonas sp. TaxID=28214 RepID=UPI002C913D76|nr:translocation/assembly module TamB domain-containing protein [Sphingomonas sp.]HTG38527.1 translocation/assembly module TamB domain-containing protein [Sphingomonas sp.]